ncbi:hypothetical protein [Alcanivorax sp.]|uniref:hypothetical protein n=1 Tax=Alcanivorax sp. TaxID=1872427 RepID=UPI000C3BBDE6|nr:hypothetical protein [Alcanivorax sp.]MBQ23701.1 hypothetical protein [Alcanivorax sp.]|tara:strand:- start:72 stop:377 length:306 start_codon:yes stop_codon:yes gene_type:complete
MKTLSLLCLCSCLLVLTAVEVQTTTPNQVSARTNSAMPASKNIIPAMPRSPDILQSVHGAPVHFDAFQTINLNDDDGIEFGISVKELNLHLVNQRTGNRLI